MKIIVTGGAGFIGSHLVDRLLKDGNEVIVIDNLSSGKMEFIKHNMKNPRFCLVKVDLLGNVDEYFKSVDEVWHLAANPDVRTIDANVHVKQNILSTKNVLEAMRKNNVKRIFFTSSSTVYGEAISSGKMVPTGEGHITEPISLYGAAKLSSESIIRAYCNCFEMNSWIFRFANVIGPRSTHGVIFDFIKKLKENPSCLEILGNGKQKKSYVYIEDCIEAMLTARKKSNEIINIFNIGSDDWIEVLEIAKILTEKMKLKPKFNFTGGDRGWKGDVPLMILEIEKIKKTGWVPKYNSSDSVIKTIESII